MHDKQAALEDQHLHDHPHDHDHDHRPGLWGWLLSILHLNGHTHDHGDIISERAFRENEEGIRTVWISLALLLVTAVLQLWIVFFSGSVSLFADTAHNIGDGLNSIPLLIAFYLARRLPTKRYTYGYGRAEDVAGIFIVLSIAVSAGIVFWEAIDRFLNPQPMSNFGWVAAAGVLGFLGNEAVAVLQIRVGRKIGSAAMVADGLHARTDGLTSLAVLAAAGGAWLGFPILDPIIGLVIGVAIVAITWDASKTVWYRLMDAVDPELTAQAEHALSHVPNVKEIRRLRMRWVGHQLQVEVQIAVDGGQGDVVAQAVRDALHTEIKMLTEVVVEVI